MTSVINIKSKQRYDVYIGRAVPRKGLAASKWANPFKVGKHGTREEVLLSYLVHVLSVPELRRDMHELKDKTLACWCKPEACHGDVLAALVEFYPGALDRVLEMAHFDETVGVRVDGSSIVMLFEPDLVVDSTGERAWLLKELQSWGTNTGIVLGRRAWK